MEIIDTQNWSSEDTSLLKQFLQTRTGQKLIPQVLVNAPVPLRNGSVNEILIRNGELIGFREAIMSLLALQAPPPPQPDAVVHGRQYPDPADDSQWNDGAKTQ